MLRPINFTRQLTKYSPALTYTMNEISSYRYPYRKNFLCSSSCVTLGATLLVGSLPLVFSYETHLTFGLMVVCSMTCIGLGVTAHIRSYIQPESSDEEPE